MLSRPTKTLLALLAISSFTSAGWFDDRLNAIVHRQETNVSETASTIPTVAPSPETESTTPSATPSASATPTPTPTPSVSTTPIVSTSSTPTPTPSVPSTPTPTPSSSSTVETKETITSTPAIKKETSATATFAPVTKVSSLTLTVTRDNGEVVTQTSASTAITTPTSAADAKLAADGSGTKNGDGMSSQTKTTVIGVVVGIGGAILLAGLAVVAWRIWGRKKNGDEGEDLMEYNRPDTVEKSGSSGGSSNPFQSTLENYHNPAKQVNASSNF